ncbi:MAG: hypothetical protein KGD63_05925 [Candidatus Lokiarchaeota archaeon]|nr:hypothetical protein [Candidatus Lokiarchaeota archaeon]
MKYRLRKYSAANVRIEKLIKITILDTDKYFKRKELRELLLRNNISYLQLTCKSIIIEKCNYRKFKKIVKDGV